jgi:hypothetical protein
MRQFLVRILCVTIFGLTLAESAFAMEERARLQISHCRFHV